MEIETVVEEKTEEISGMAEKTVPKTQKVSFVNKQTNI